MSVMSAYVEIVFDNADSRIPIDRDEVTLRRTIGLKKDEYFLDSKHVSKTEVMNLLESSGFSRSNPYYIVQQGRIVQLATMRDGDRLSLLKEVAGTKVYDDRRAQSCQILEDTKTKKERIEEVLTYIEERLAELEDEKEELREYQQLDRDKRAIEYTIHDKELRATRDTLEKLDASRQEEAGRRDETHDTAEQEKELISELSADLARLKSSVAQLKRSKQTHDEDKAEQLSGIAKLELDVQELEGAAADGKQTERQVDDELAQLKKSIAALEKQIAAVEPEREAQRTAQQALQQEHDQALARQDALYGKQTRAARFASVRERGQWIDSELG